MGSMRIVAGPKGLRPGDELTVSRAEPIHPYSITVQIQVGTCLS